jgi:hypothetical protein
VELAPQPSAMAVSFNREGDVLGLNFKKWSHADERELTDDDAVVRQAQG